MRIFALIVLPVLLLANIGLEAYYNWLGTTPNLDEFLKWRIVSVLSWQLFNFAGLMLMLYFGTFKKSFLAKFSLFALLFMAIGLFMQVKSWSGGAQLIFGGSCIILVTYTAHFNRKKKSKSLLDWLKCGFVICFVLNAAYNAYLIDVINISNKDSKILKLIMFIMFIVFYVNLLKEKTPSNDGYMTIDSEGNQIFIDNPDNETI